MRSKTNETKTQMDVKTWNRHYRKECIKDVAIKIFSGTMITLFALTIMCVVVGIASLF